MSDEDQGPNLLNILIYAGAGALITYIWLNKNKAQVKSSLENQYLLYSQNNELLEQIKLLNETLTRRDNLLNEYQQTIQKQYQNIPAMLGSSISNELQQIALYLDAVNTQLEQIANQTKQILDQNQYQYQQSQCQYQQNNIQSQQKSYKKLEKQVSENKEEKEPVENKKSVENKEKPYYDEFYAKIQPDNGNQLSDNTADIDTNNIDANKWKVKRGKDGRIRSLNNVPKVINL